MADDRLESLLKDAEGLLAALAVQAPPAAPVLARLLREVREQAEIIADLKEERGEIWEVRQDYEPTVGVYHSRTEAEASARRRAAKIIRPRDEVTITLWDGERQVVVLEYDDEDDTFNDRDLADELLRWKSRHPDRNFAVVADKRSKRTAVALAGPAEDARGGTRRVVQHGDTRDEAIRRALDRWPEGK